MNVELSNGRTYYFGYDRSAPEYRDFDGSSFQRNGAVLIGFSALLDSKHPTDTSPEPHLKHVTVIYNKCDDEELFQMS